MFRKLKYLTTLLLILVSLFITGCVATLNVIYSVGSEKYYSKELAFQRLEQIHTELLSQILPINNTMQKSAIVAVPSQDRIERTGIKYSGNKASILPEQIDYIKAYTFKDFGAMYKVIEKRHIFRELKFVYNDSPEKTQFVGYDFLVYLYNPSPDIAKWYIKSHSWEKPCYIPLDSNKQGASRILSWLIILEELARQ